jgi:pyruvate formate lyase activating enzyme
VRQTPGVVASTLHSSMVDGPGNRFVVFCQGCNFDCVNCHNPQTIPRRSVHARLRTVDDLLAELLPLAPFLSGITVSGGEPTLQRRFVRELFAAVRTHPDLGQLTTFLDTNGSLPRAGWHQLGPWLDGAMVDVKAVDPVIHRRITRQDNDAVLDSVRWLHRAEKLHEIRLLVIPGVNDDAAVLERYAAFVRSVDRGMRVRVMAYRHHGVRASGLVWREATPADTDRVEELLRGEGLTGVIPALHLDELVSSAPRS